MWYLLTGYFANTMNPHVARNNDGGHIATSVSHYANITFDYANYSFEYYMQQPMSDMSALNFSDSGNIRHVPRWTSGSSKLTYR